VLFLSFNYLVSVGRIFFYFILFIIKMLFARGSTVRKRKKEKRGSFSFFDLKLHMMKEKEETE
jgi:hypothetical protein